MTPSRKGKIRLDELLVSRGSAESRTRAKAMIMAGEVLVDDAPVTKAGSLVAPEAVIRIKQRPRYVSRGGEKLAGALEDLNLDVTGMKVLDIGASTGGFVDCLLSCGAAAVCACDVGYGQLAWKLRCDERVQVLDRVNGRNLEASQLPWIPDLITCDVSFISLRLLMRPIRRILPVGGRALLLVKPQFEVGKGRVGKGGVVRDRSLRIEAVEGILWCGAEHGLRPLGLVSSRVAGPAGNRECFVLFDIAPAENARMDDRNTETGTGVEDDVQAGEMGRKVWRPWLKEIL